MDVVDLQHEIEGVMHFLQYKIIKEFDLASYCMEYLEHEEQCYFQM